METSKRLMLFVITCGVIAFPPALVAQNQQSEPSNKTTEAPQEFIFPGKGDEGQWKKASELAKAAQKAQLGYEPESAIKKYSEAVIIYPYDAQIYYALGILYLDRPSSDAGAKDVNSDAAELCLRRALKLNPKLWYVWEKLGRISYKRRSYAEALYEYQQSLVCNPPASEAKGAIKERMESALREIDKARAELAP